MNLWTARELVEASQGQMQGDWNCDGLSIDSRDIAPGDMFVALKAARDGHEFVQAALTNGAAGALVSFVPEGCEHANLLIVEDVEAALARLGQFRRKQVDAKIVAITGSAGKTSTKEMLLTTLSQFGQTHASVKSFNNHWGVPLTLARMPANTKFGVFEIGMNHPGEISPLVQQVRPDVAVITNIAPVHMAGFENEEGIAREKASIMTGLGANGVGIVNGDMYFRDFVAELTGRELRYFGFGENNAIRAEKISLLSDASTAEVVVDQERLELNLQTAGEHHVMNALAVIGVLQAFGLDIAKGMLALANWLAPEGRGQIFTISSGDGQFTIVDESYNANPLSMRAAIDAFNLRPAKRHIAVLGDMKELGANSERFHAELASYDGVESLDLVHAVGIEIKPFYDALKKKSGAILFGCARIFG